MTQMKSEEKSDEKQTIGNVLSSAHQIWLAGLGAFAKAEKEGTKLFESLVKEGEKVEARAKRVVENKVEEIKGKVENAVEEVRDRATDTWDGLEQVFEDRVARVLNRLGVPTYEDIQELSKRVEALNENVKALTKK